MKRNPELEIVLKIKNNTNFAQPVELFSAVPNNNFANNSNEIYTWNLSTENYVGSYNVTILISNSSNPTPVYYSIPLSGNNIQSVVDALNTLNQGIFQASGTTIYVSNNYYIYGALEVVSTIFTSTWNTNNTSVGSSASNQIQLPLDVGGIYNFVVDWGDGSQDTITIWNQAQTLHTYAVAGTYILSINGIIQGFSFNFNGDRNKLLSIANWGTLNLGNNGNYFNGCNNLDLSSVIGVLDLSGTTNIDYLFGNCTFLTTINNINQWDVSNVVSMVDTFSGATSFNDNISSWNTLSVIDMNSMFQGATSFNQPLNSWNVSNVSIFTSMFSGATSFNQPLNYWNVSGALIMDNMFSQANNFNQDLASWNVSNVQNMSSMFFLANSFNKNISAWNVSNVTNFSNMFRSATSFNQPLNYWNVSSSIDMSAMFRSATSFNQPLNSWNVSNAINMSEMFRLATSFNQNIGSWNVSNVTNFTDFMRGKTNLNYSTTNLDAIYNGWSLLTVQPTITISFGTIKYTLAGQSGKNILTGAPNNWVITDGGI